MGITIKKGGTTKYIKGRGAAPLSYEERKISDSYSEELKTKISDIKAKLKKEGFFEMKNDLKKWLLLGRELQFLKESELRKVADPDLLYTWQALYVYAPELAPKPDIPTEEGRAIGKRNHFLICYRLAQLDQATFNKLTSWRDFNDIYMSFTTLAWEDADRLIDWILFKSSEGGNFRKELVAVRATVGKRSKHKLYTKLLSREELFSKLDKVYANLKTN